MPRAGTPRRSPPHPAGAPATALAVENYLAAWRWRRELARRLKSVGLTFPQWFVLRATHRLIGGTKDAVNQNDVARLTELDRMTVSQIMATLAKRGHVDRDSDSSGRGYRIWVTSKGEKTLTFAEKHLAALPAALPAPAARTTATQ